MHVAVLELAEFRSYRSLLLDLPAAGVRLAGDNASGKSSLLEAIMMLATTRSPRTSTDRDLINWNSGVELTVPPYARVRGVIARAGEVRELEIALQVDPSRPTQVKKQIKRNRRPVRAVDAVGTLNAVMFSPEDIELISGSPSGRRRYLDATISQLDRAYLRALSRYARVLEQRNSLLKSLGAAGAGSRSRTSAEQIDFWDQELTAHGALLVARRLRFLYRLNQLAREQFAQLAGRDDLQLAYLGAVPTSNRDLATTDDAELQLVVARDYERELRNRRSEEFRRGMSLVGPHRDDIQFRLGEVDVAAFGSRGQQRLVVVAVKLAIAAVMAEAAGEAPVVMLDDVLSELDARHREWVLAAAGAAGSQLIVTATDRELLDTGSLSALPLMQVASGIVRALD